MGARSNGWTLEQQLLDGREIKNGCWLWSKGCFTDGYGSLSFYSRILRVHRVAAHIYLGMDLDSPIVVCHKCRNKNCFNPDHIYLGTKSSNTLDSVKDRTHVWAKKTHCPQGHEYTKENTYINPRGQRYCRTCSNIRRERYR